MESAAYVECKVKKLGTSISANTYSRGHFYAQIKCSELNYTVTHFCKCKQFKPEDEGSTFLQNLGICLQDYSVTT